MNDKRSPHFYLAIFWLLISIVTLCSGATPQRPYYSETPNPRHIANNDRLTAEYFNNQLNVIYNWAQRTNTELDNLLHNGIGVASITVGILNCTNKIINPEWDDLLHNGNGVASITVGLVKTNDLEISNKINVPAVEFSGRSQPTPPVSNGLLYFDSDLQRFRVYQEDGWRDLSSNYIIDGTTLTNPLIIDGYLDTRNIYVNNNASISKNLYVQENINSSGTATIQNVNVLNDSTINRNLTVKGKLNASGTTTLESLKANSTMKVPVTANTSLGVGSVYFDTTTGKLKVLNSSNNWEDVGKDIVVDASMSSTSTNPVQNKVINSFLTGGNKDLNVKSIKITNASITNRLDVRNASVTNELDVLQLDVGLGMVLPKTSLTSHLTTDNATPYYDPSSHSLKYAYIDTSNNNVTTHTFLADHNWVNSNYAAKNHNHDTVYAAKNHNHDSAYAAKSHNHDSLYAAINHNHDTAYAAKNHTHTYDSELNDTSTNAVQNKKIKAYIDAHSGGSDLASETLDFSLPMYKYTNPTLVTHTESDGFGGSYTSHDYIKWTETAISNYGSVNVYKVSDDFVIVDCGVGLGYTYGSPYAAGTYGISITGSAYTEVTNAVDGLWLESISCVPQDSSGLVEAENPRIIRTNSSFMCVVYDLKSTQQGSGNIYVRLFYRKYRY